MSKEIINKLIDLTSDKDARVEVLAELVPQTNSMMYADYFIPTTVENSYGYVRGHIVKDSICLKTKSLFVEVFRKDRNDTVSILCNLDTVFILALEG